MKAPTILQAGARAPEEIVRTALISECGRLRWSLGRSWSDAPKSLVIMVNPSTADHQVDDPTIKRLIGWHQRWDMGGFTVMNLIPFRSSTPAEAFAFYRDKMVPADGMSEIHPDQVLMQILDAADDAVMVLVAWGRLPPYLAPLARQLTYDLTKPKCLGWTKDGSPIHPMARGKHRVPENVTPQAFFLEPTCRVCGCTDLRACPGGCWWVEFDLCSACKDKGGDEE